MFKGLIALFILGLLTFIFGIIGQLLQIIIPQVILLGVVVYLLIRVRMKVARGEKEQLRHKIEELERKIRSVAEAAR
jgi:hypothetical protein